MIETSLAESGYSSSIQSTGSARNIEYEVFARVTRDLSNRDKSAPDYSAKIAHALRDNLRLWTILANDVAKEGNKLPQELRSSIFYLSEFTRHHTAKVYNGEAGVRTLVDVNTMIMRGLRGSATHAPGAAQ